MLGYRKFVDLGPIVNSRHLPLRSPAQVCYYFKPSEDRCSGEPTVSISPELQRLISEEGVSHSLAQYLAKQEAKQEANQEKTAQQARLGLRLYIFNLVSEELKFLTGPKGPRPVGRFPLSGPSQEAKRKLARVNELLPQHLGVTGVGELELELTNALNALSEDRFNGFIHFSSKVQLEAAIASAVASFNDELRREMPLECWLLENYQQLVPIFGFSRLGPE